MAYCDILFHLIPLPNCHLYTNPVECVKYVSESVDVTPTYKLHPYCNCGWMACQCRPQPGFNESATYPVCR